MLQKIRIFLLWLRDKYKLATTVCAWCGTRGVDSTSIAYPDSICADCDYEMQLFIKRTGTNKLPPGLNVAQALEILEADNIPCDEGDQETPCFDTFPGPAPKVCNGFSFPNKPTGPTSSARFE